MKAQSLLSGLIGAGVLTLIHETARHHLDDAPRVDIVGKRALLPALKAAGFDPSADQLHNATLGAEVVSNTLYYALAGIGKPEHALRRGMILGLAAGLGAAFLPPHMKLGRAPVQRTPQTAVMTVLWYFTGGVAAGIARRVMD